MTNERAIKILSSLRSQCSCFDEYEEPYYRAFSMAIKALRTEAIPIEWFEKVRKKNEEKLGLPCWICVVPEYSAIDFSKAIDLIEMYKAEIEQDQAGLASNIDLVDLWGKENA